MANPKKKQNLKEMMLAPFSGFRHETVKVPEWGDAEIIIREPSAEAWLRWQDMIKTDSKDGLNDEEGGENSALINLRADVILFVDVVYDTDWQPVFTAEDVPAVEKVYGPVHNRLLRQSFEMVTNPEYTKKK